MNKHFVRGLLCGIPVTIILLIIGFILTVEFFYHDTLKEPDFSVSDLVAENGSVFQLSHVMSTDTLSFDYRSENDVIFINFWTTSCAPCIAEMPSIEKLMNELDNSRVKFYLISPEPLEQLQNNNKIKEFHLPFYKLIGNSPAPFQGRSVPRTYICYRGKVIYSHVGALDWSSPKVVALIDRILASS